MLGLPLIAIPMPLIMSKFDAYYRTIKKIKENNDVRDRILAGNQMDVSIGVRERVVRK